MSLFALLLLYCIKHAPPGSVLLVAVTVQQQLVISLRYDSHRGCFSTYVHVCVLLCVRGMRS